MGRSARRQTREPPPARSSAVTLTTAGVTGRRPAGAASRQRGCRSAWSKARRGRAAPESSVSPRPPAGASCEMRHAGGADAARCDGVPVPRRRPRTERKSALLGVAEASPPRPRLLQALRDHHAASSPSGTTRSLPPFPSTRTCLLEVDVAEVEPPLRHCATRRSRRTPRGREFRSASGPSPSSLSSVASTSADRGGSGSRRARRGVSAASGTRRAPRVERRNERTAASRREMLAGARRVRPRPRSAAYSVSSRIPRSDSSSCRASSQCAKCSRSTAV